ncbi:MAG: RsmE family RNA methyltransferase [Candidatus Gracilibacteria bacterium]|nr:RsmE family RNA methyltransferase [Candidatus Gracilibacteria bacterium]
MQRFSFLDLSLGQDISISEETFVHQIAHVLRSRPGEQIILFNGDGYDYIYTIVAITKKSIVLTYSEKQQNSSDFPMSIRLYQSLPNKYEKIEYILQKGVEVGVSEFIFFRAERSQKLVIHARKIERFQEIVREATEQCGGNTLPFIQFLETGIPSPKEGISYFLHTKSLRGATLKSIAHTSDGYNIFIGPEGGWSEQEAIIFDQKDIQNLSLGTRILRTETAGPMTAFFLAQR